MTIIKILLILAVVALLLVLLRSHGTNKGGAYVKIGMAVFLAFAAYAVIRPDDVTWVAAQLGVGRGTDLVLYMLVLGFGFFAISTYLRFKEMELKFARLARAIALAEAERSAVRRLPDDPPSLQHQLAGEQASSMEIGPEPSGPADRRAEAFSPDGPESSRR